MATGDGMKWQAEHMADSSKALNYNLRAAAEKALELDRPLTEDEFEAFRLDKHNSMTPIKQLVYKGTKLVAI